MITSRHIATRLNISETDPQDRAASEDKHHLVQSRLITSIQAMLCHLPATYLTNKL